MPLSFRAASFNLENLFSRAKILNLEDHKETTRLLDMVSKLAVLIAKRTYTAADGKEIARLAKALSDYVIIREDIGKLFTGKGANRRVTAGGRDDWAGAIEFKREKVSELARESTILAIKSVKADIMAVVEAEDRLILDEFNTQGLKTRRFAEVMCIDGNDKRGIDVGLLSNYPITDIRPHIYDAEGRSRTFSRDCPEHTLELPGGRNLHVLVNHFVSKMNGDPPSSRNRRLRQATAVAKILERYDLKKDLVIVAGDLNDTPDSDPLAPLLRKRDLHDVLKLKYGNDMSQRWTYKYRSELNQIDYLLVSTPLKDAFQDAGVERRGIPEIAKVIPDIVPFPTVTSWRSAASDHGAVWADFTL